MARSKSLAAYPSTMTEALHRAVDLGEFRIKCESPKHVAALRLHFYGLFSALRHAGRPDLPDMLSLVISSGTSELILRLRDNDPMLDAVSVALKASPGGSAPSPESAESSAAAALDRILGGSSNA